MKRKFTGQYERSNDKKPIYVGDLVTLSIPRKNKGKKLIVFKVIEDDGYRIIYHSGEMSVGDPNYKQELSGQVYKVVGNIKSGINEDLLV